MDNHNFCQGMYNHFKFGGNLSIRKPKEKKVVIIFGQDECIFKQYAFPKKSWTLPDDTKQLIPKIKDKESCFLILSLDLYKDNLNVINLFRKNIQIMMLQLERMEIAQNLVILHIHHLLDN